MIHQQRGVPGFYKKVTDFLPLLSSTHRYCCVCVCCCCGSRENYHTHINNFRQRPLRCLLLSVEFLELQQLSLLTVRFAPVRLHGRSEVEAVIILRLMTKQKSWVFSVVKFWHASFLRIHYSFLLLCFRTKQFFIRCDQRKQQRIVHKTDSRRRQCERCWGERRNSSYDGTKFPPYSSFESVILFF